MHMWHWRYRVVKGASATAEERYGHLMGRYPNLLQRIPAIFNRFISGHTAAVA
jgi:hypothetical protein